MLLHRLIAIPLVTVLALPLPAQEAAATPQAEPIKIVVLEGNGATNDLKAGTGVPPRVQVVSESGQPVAGAEVVFSLPASGASAYFAGGIRTQTLRTSSDGVAAAGEYTPNGDDGPFQIKVDATAGERTASALVSQSNVNGVKYKESKKKWYIVAGVAATVAAMVGLAVARDAR